jgi:uncharacterized membrane protein
MVLFGAIVILVGIFLWFVPPRMSWWYANYWMPPNWEPDEAAMRRFNRVAAVAALIIGLTCVAIGLISG